MQPVFVVGVPRGGTTWIAETLSKCRAVRYVHEPDGAHDPFAFRARRRDQLAHYPVLHPGAEAPEFARLWAGVFAGGAKRATVRDHLARRAYQRVTPAAKHEATASGHLSMLLRVTDALAEPRSAGEPATVLAKSVNAPLAAAWIADRFQPATLVVQRDLRNVLASWLALDFEAPAPKCSGGSWPKPNAGGGLRQIASDDGFARAATMVTVMTLALHDDACARGWAVIEHEAACVDPEVRMRAAADAVGLEWTEAATEFVVASDQPGTGYETQRVARSLPAGWKTKLSADHLARIETATAAFPDELRSVAIPN